MKRYFFKTRFAAIILIAAGYGWAGGHYIPVNSSILAYVFQFIIITALLIMGIKFLSIAESDRHKNNWSITGLSIFSVLSLLLNILNIIHGAYSSENSFGSHNTFADLLPISLLIIGNGLWIITIVRSNRHHTKSQYLSNSQYNIL
jgi:hypothetical protein